MYTTAVRLGKRPGVGAFVSFFAVPYGLIALLAGLRTGKPVHVGFVGSDWHRDCKSPVGRLLNLWLRRAALISVPGKPMKAEMAAAGYRARRIFCLPHAVDLSRYKDKPPLERRYDCIFLGYLVAVKRVDLMLEAILKVRRRLPEVRLCIVGDGPLRASLAARAARLGLQRNVVFAGYQSRPQKWLSDARILLISSDAEGLPFALIEGMAAGCVPVCSSVGSIPEIIRHDVSGILVKPGNAAAIAEAVKGLLTDYPRYLRLRAGVLEQQRELGFEHAADIWTGKLATLGIVPTGVGRGMVDTPLPARKVDAPRRERHG
jgi:glycosyltransferase involved in cell wall biosynthesis